MLSSLISNVAMQQTNQNLTKHRHGYKLYKLTLRQVDFYNSYYACSYKGQIVTTTVIRARLFYDENQISKYCTCLLCM